MMDESCVANRRMSMSTVNNSNSEAGTVLMSRAVGLALAAGQTVKVRVIDAISALQPSKFTGKVTSIQKVGTCGRSLRTVYELTDDPATLASCAT